MALKKEGKAIPITDKYNTILSINLSLFKAEITPKIKPKTKPNKIAKKANKKVLGNVVLIIVETFKLDFTNEVLK